MRGGAQPAQGALNDKSCNKQQSIRLTFAGKKEKTFEARRRPWASPKLPRASQLLPGSPPGPEPRGIKLGSLPNFLEPLLAPKIHPSGLGQEISKPFLLTDGRESGFSPSRQRGPPSDFGSLGGRQTPPRAEKPDFPETRAAHFWAAPGASLGLLEPPWDSPGLPRAS